MKSAKSRLAQPSKDGNNDCFFRRGKMKKAILAYWIPPLLTAKFLPKRCVRVGLGSEQRPKIYFFTISFRRAAF